MLFAAESDRPTRVFEVRTAAVPGYEIMRELGRGATGLVYRARRTKLDRVAALNIILAGGHAVNLIWRTSRRRRSLAVRPTCAGLSH